MPGVLTPFSELPESLQHMTSHSPAPHGPRERTPTGGRESPRIPSAKLSHDNSGSQHEIWARQCLGEGLTPRLWVSSRATLLKAATNLLLHPCRPVSSSRKAASGVVQPGARLSGFESWLESSGTFAPHSRLSSGVLMVPTT